MAPTDSEPLQLRRYRDSDHDEVVRLHHLELEPFGADAGPGPWDDDLEDTRVITSNAEISSLASRTVASLRWER
jgi:hypothetical protein